MAGAENVAFNTAAFVSALFLLEFGADKFVDHTAIVSRRLNLPQAVIGLLTAGAEWEELAVVVASLARARSSLAVGNVIGSAISNILGAFSLGLLSLPRDGNVVFDKSSRIYSGLLLLLTTLVVPATYFARRDVWRVCGGLLVVFFAMYVASVAWAIARRRITAPELSESGDSSDGTGSETDDATGDSEGNQDERQPLVDAERLPPPSRRRPRHRVWHHIFFLLLGFFSICLAGYVLSHAAASITVEFGMSDVVFGVVVLAVATTLPEKLVAVFSGLRGHVGILVANTAGSNIFLLSLCMGIIMIDTEGDLDRGNVSLAELGTMWGCTLAFTATVWLGGKWSRWMGAGMLVCYVVFLMLEFTVVRRA